MRILGLDVGDKTIGVAVSDSLGITAQGVDTIRRKSFEKDFEAIEGFMEEYEVSEVVVGLPKSLDGSLGPQAEKVQAFVDRFKKSFDVKVTYWDERLSTAMAERALIQADVSRAKRRMVIDKLAAQIILQGFLDRKANERGR